jgi:RNA polymerase sigma-70 factor (ECF subfamily)
MAGSDAKTIQAVLDGDVDRFAELVDKYQEHALKLAYSFLGNYEDAKDASQEAFVSAYRSLGRFRGGAKFSTWLYRIVVNECKDVYKRRARQPSVVAAVGESDPDRNGVLFVDVEDPGAGPSDQAANRELAHQLSTEIGRLPMKQRTAFLLHHVHGLPLEEVAAVMRCRLGTVKSHVFRATDHLREAFS